MKNIFILFALLVSGITTKTVYNDIIDVWYNYEYSLTKLYSSYNTVYFRAEIIPGNKFDVELKMNFYELNKNYFRVYIYQFSSYPSNDDIHYRRGSLYNDGMDAEYGEAYKEDDYYVLTYHYKKARPEDYYAIKLV